MSVLDIMQESKLELLLFCYWYRRSDDRDGMDPRAEVWV